MANEYKVNQIRSASAINDLGQLVDMYEVYAETNDGDRFMVRFPKTSSESEMRSGVEAEARKLIAVRRL